MRQSRVPTPRPPHPVRKVALVVQAMLSGGREVARGICRHAEQHGQWQLIMGDELVEPREIARVAGIVDGILLVSPTHAQVRTARHLPKPVVAVSCDMPGIPTVNTDDRHIGATAYRHLRSLGLTHFASVGIARAPFSMRRQDGFESAAGRGVVRRYGRSLYATLPADPDELAELHSFVRSLPTPCGVFAVTTWVAATFIRIVRDMGLRVPDDFAVLGVTNDDMASEYSHPGISTVDDRAAAAGALAADLLAKQMGGLVPPLPTDKPLIVPCGEVVTRGSTDTLAVDDPGVRAAVEFIRAHALGPLKVADVVRRLPVSRRKLERAFSTRLGRTMHDEIIRVRIDEARRLLRNTNLPMKEIASMCGFADDSKFSTAFKKTLGITPRDYRRQSLLR